MRICLELCEVEYANPIKNPIDVDGGWYLACCFFPFQFPRLIHFKFETVMPKCFHP